MGDYKTLLKLIRLWFNSFDCSLNECAECQSEKICSNLLEIVEEIRRAGVQDDI